MTAPLRAIAIREFASMFRLPVGWITIALFGLLASLVFVLTTLAPGEPATLRYFFATAGWLLVPVVPAVSMRLLSEETRSGTIEPLRTSPASDADIVWGKYLGALAFLAVTTLATLPVPIVLFALSDPAPDLGPIVSGYLGLLLVAALYLAIGLLASSATESQTLAFLATLMVLIAALLLSGPIADRLPPPWPEWLRTLSIQSRASDFAKGIVDLRHVVSLLGLSVWFVVAAVHVNQLRRES